MKQFFRGMSWAFAMLGALAGFLSEWDQAIYFMTLGIWWHVVGKE